MKAKGTHAIHYLTLDNLVVSCKLARHLPPGLAFRYHALPVAKDNGHITVTMANPDDEEAREAIATALDTELYVVQGDPAAIARLLTEIWPDEIDQSLRFLVCDHPSPIADQVRAYARYLSDLLNAKLNFFQTDSKLDTPLDELVEEARQGHDLVIFGEPCQSLLKRMLLSPTGCKAAERIPTSVLIARCPRWPLKRILFVTRGQTGVDNVAVDWIVRLARPGNAVVTVLAVLPPAVPAMHSQTLSMHRLTYWLTTDTPLGWQLRQIAQQLGNWETEGRLRFRQGSPDSQIQSEVAEGDPDLIVIAADSSNWWLRRIPGELVSPLLRWADRPVLIAKSTIV